MSLRAYERSDPADHVESHSPEAIGGGYRFTLARLLLDAAKDELRNNPGFTRALADRYFTNVGGMPNDISRHTLFGQGGADYRVGYEYRPDGTGGWQETLEVIRQTAEGEERLFVAASQHLANPTDSRYTVDGHIAYATNNANVEPTDAHTADAFTAAQAIVRGLCASSAPQRENSASSDSA